MWQCFVNLMVVSFKKYRCVSNHQVVHIKFIECYMSTLSQEWLKKKPIDLPFSRLPSTPGSLARCLPEELRVAGKPLGLLLYASHSWFLFSLNNSRARLKSNIRPWCLFSTRAMPHPLPTNNLQSLYKGTFLVMSDTIVCLLPVSLFFWFDLPCLFSYVYMQIILPELEHLVLHRLDSTISKTLETQVRGNFISNFNI